MILSKLKREKYHLKFVCGEKCPDQRHSPVTKKKLRLYI